MSRKEGKKFSEGSRNKLFSMARLSIITLKRAANQRLNGPINGRAVEGVELGLNTMDGQVSPTG